MLLNSKGQATIPAKHAQTRRMRSMREAEGVTFPEAYVDRREAEVPIREANSALFSSPTEG
jgi:hypothetical protein